MKTYLLALSLFIFTGAVFGQDIPKMRVSYIEKDGKIGVIGCFGTVWFKKNEVPDVYELAFNETPSDEESVYKPNGSVIGPKPIGFGVEDLRSWCYDTEIMAYRPYRNGKEILVYLEKPKFRFNLDKQQLPFIVKGKKSLEAWRFVGGINDTNLIYIKDTTIKLYKR